MAIIPGTIGNDSLFGTVSDDEIYGFEGHDYLYGGGGNDLLFGGDGNDTLDGQAGADVMDGGDGNDTYYVDDSGDTIIESEADGDTDIVYVYVSYFDVGSAYVEQIYYSGNGSGTLLGSDGNNFMNAGTGNDWLDGRGGNDWLFGGGGDDYLVGGAGNDELDGWQGNDTMIGGTGDDVYHVDSAGDVVTEYANEGTDTVKVRMSSYTLPANVENADLRHYSGPIEVTGNSGNNVFYMGAGAQTVNGGTGIDTVSYAYTAAVSVDLWNQNMGGEAADDTLTGIENLTGSAYDDVLRALGGASVIDGGPGADIMEGRNGNDIYYVDDAGDLVIEGAGGGTDEVRIRNLASYTLPAYVEKLTNVTNHMFTGTGNSAANEINGGTGRDILYGAGGNDTLNGGDGDDELHGGGEHDILNGGAGSDDMYGGEGNDVYFVDYEGDNVIELAGEGTDQVYTTLTNYMLSDHVENLGFNGAGDPALNFIGSNVGNIIVGRAGDDILDGQGGADELRGGAGNDVLHGGAGDDLLIGGAGADVLCGGTGGDLFRFSDGDSGTGAEADVITDFVNWVDKVDLRGIDANSAVAGDQAFSFIGTAAFSGTAGELRYAFAGTDILLQGDFTGDGVADFEILFTDCAVLFATDFYL
ncbi:MAG TPA: calcium-binding protein [Allosphingosinicella sp.]|nr:calcium-binding protein [Allosphingosinicella sp.]